MQQLEQKNVLMKRFAKFIVGLLDDCTEPQVLTDRQHCVFHVFQEFDLMSLRNIESEMKLMRSITRGEAARVVISRVFDFDREGNLIWVQQWTRDLLELDM